MADMSRGGPRVGPNYEERAEFGEAVDRAVKERVDALLPDLMARLAVAQGAVSSAANGSSPQDGNFVAALALQLAELTGQGTGRIYVAPEIVERRRNALGELKELLLRLHAQRQVPTYQLKSHVYLNLGGRLGEVLIDPLYRDNAKIVQKTEIDWPGVPNLSMEPLNEPAKQVFALFAEWVGHGAGVKEADEMIALNSHGAVVRGAAARAILAHDRSAREVGEPGDNPDMPAAAIRRHDKAPVEKVNVLGTLHPQIEIS